MAWKSSFWFCFFIKPILAQHFNGSIRAQSIMILPWIIKHRPVKLSAGYTKLGNLLVIVWTLELGVCFSNLWLSTRKSGRVCWVGDLPNWGFQVWIPCILSRSSLSHRVCLFSLFFLVTISIHWFCCSLLIKVLYIFLTCWCCSCELWWRNVEICFLFYLQHV